jgi:hypothetical protein
MIEIGVLSPEQGIESIRTGKLPSADELAPAQDALFEQRKKGHYNPIVGGIPVIEEFVGAPTATPTNSTAGRPTVAQASRKDIQSTIYEIDAFMKSAASFAADKFKVEKLNEQQNDSVNQLCKKIVASSKRGEWVTNLQRCLNDIENIEKLSPMQEILDTAEEYALEEYSAAIFYHSAVK